VRFRLRSVRNSLRKRSPPHPSPWDSPPGRGEGQAAGLGKNRCSRLPTGCVTGRRLAAPALLRSQPGAQAAILKAVGQL